MALTNIAILDKIAALLPHSQPIKNIPDSLESLMIPFMSAVVELGDDSLDSRRCSLEVDPVLEIDESDMQLPRTHDFILFDPFHQSLEVEVLLNLTLDRLYPVRNQFREGQEGPFHVA